MRYWLDTNVLLRLVTKTPPDLFERALALVAQAEFGALSLAVHPLHVAGATYLLRRLYTYTHEEIRRELGIVLRLEALAVHDEEHVLAALDLMAERNVDFDDAYLALWAATCGDGVASFDDDQKKLPVTLLSA
ncbi:PIN domain-containing protein [Thermomicrobiaceae bacterium CFH 74404]|uniref:PIN domain-containing protein n=1 Tax=Thermalbibacter longus TaxID=2951981 RepID=A0AA41WGL9_9BACT|nr:PIN domain-containing protein [Thermalbibacter longus]MCM8750234.1 PIN domain-containing protein [Thermalbibacter longus]